MLRDLTIFEGESITMVDYYIKSNCITKKVGDLAYLTLDKKYIFWDGTN